MIDHFDFSCLAVRSTNIGAADLFCPRLGWKIAKFKVKIQVIFVGLKKPKSNRNIKYIPRISFPNKKPLNFVDFLFYILFKFYCCSRQPSRPAQLAWAAVTFFFVIVFQESASGSVCKQSLYKILVMVVTRLEF